MASNYPHSEPRNKRKTRMTNVDASLLNNWADQLFSSPTAKKNNSTREREAGLTQERTPVTNMRKEPPHSYPRTKTSAHINALESLRQTLSFRDEPVETTGDEEISSRISDDTVSQDSGVQDGSAADSNQIVGRLMQIRDYLKQATDMKLSLDKDSSNSQEQFVRLNNLIEHLREQEDSYLALLQKMLTDRTTAATLNDSNVTLTSRAIKLSPHVSPRNTAYNTEQHGDESEASVDVDNVSQVSDCTTDKEAEVQALKEQRDLLKKMLDQQRTLKELHERQAQLLELKKQAEDQLAAGDEVTDEDKDRDETGAVVEINGRGELEESDVEEGEIPHGAAAEVIPPELMELRKRLVYLQNVFDTNLSEQLSDQQKLQTLKDMQSDAERINIPPQNDTSNLVQNDSSVTEQSCDDNSESEMSNAERRQLRNKLAELQDKKNRMEGLLSKLQSMRRVRKRTGEEVSDVESEVTSTDTYSALKQGAEQARLATQTAGQAETVLDVMEQESKMKKLGQLKERLDTLRQMIQYYQVGEDNSQRSSRRSSVAGSENDLSLIGNIRRAQITADRSSDRNESLTVSDTESRASISSTRSAELRNDPEYQRKINQLDAAKRRLAQLQALVSVVQTFPDTAEILPSDLAELAESMLGDSETNQSGSEAQSEVDEDEGSVRSQVSSSSGAQAFSDRYETSRLTNNQTLFESNTREQTNIRQSNLQSSTADSETDTVSDQEAFYQKKMLEQKAELESLKSERERLLRIQGELKLLHDNYKEQQAAVEEMEISEQSEEITPRAASVQKLSPRHQKLAQYGAAVQKLANNTKPTAVKFSPAPVNTELFSKMRAQRLKMMAEGRNLADDQTTADVTTLATWGENSEESSERDSDSSEEEDNGDSQLDQIDEGTPDEPELDDDDGYPSDGILPVEEEEEAKDSDRDTYTIDEPYSRRQRYPKSNRLGSRKAKNRNPAGGDYWLKPSGAISYNRPQATSQGVDMISKMKNQLDAVTELCQQLACQQRSQEDSGGLLPESRPYSMMETRLTYSVNQLYSQVMDMQSALQVTVDQVYAITQHLDFNADEASSQSTVRAEALQSAALPVSASRVGLPAWARPSTSHTPPRPSTRRAPAPQDLYGSRLDSLNPELALSNRESVASSQAAAQATRQIIGAAAASALDDDLNYSIPPLDLDKLIKRRQDQTKSLTASGRSYPSPSLSAIAAGRVRIPEDFNYKPGVSAGISGTAYADTASLSSAVSTFRESADVTPVQTPAGTPGKPRKNGTTPKYTNTPKSQLSKQTANSQSKLQTTAGSMDRDESGSEFSLFEALRETIYSEVATLISQNENRPHFLIELFRELQMLSSDYLRQRALYSVQELVTKFLTDETFGVSNQLTESVDDDPALAPQPAWMLYRASASEQTPSESYVTTDDEEAKQMNTNNRKHTMTPVQVEPAISVRSDFADYIEQVETTSTQSTPHSYAGTWDDPFTQDGLGDTVIHLDQRLPHPRHADLVASTSLLSVKLGSESGASDISHEIPFACNSPLQETAIDLKEAMQKVREIDRQKAAANAAAMVAQVVSSTSASSAQDSDMEELGDIQGARIDTQALDRQIKSVMNEIIPVLKEHMENVCSPQLLTYLLNRILQFVIVSDDSKEEKSEEFTQFFETQLCNILKDSLTKFTGRRMRECGEEILVDISEILFNELAFFKLMQDLDDPETRGRIALNKYKSNGRIIRQDDISTLSTENDVEVISGADDGEDSDTSAEETEQDHDADSRPAADDQVDEDYMSEKENLGKDRDDAFAVEVNIAANSQLIQPVEDGSVNITQIHDDVQYSLAPSETKPMNRIGSDEDCSDDETSSEQFSDSGDDTAISRQTAELKSTEPTRTDNSYTEPTRADNSHIEEREDDSYVERRANNSNEITPDDLPNNFTVSQTVTEQAAREQVSNDLKQEIISEQTDELVGNSTSLKEPETAAAHTPNNSPNTESEDESEKKDSVTEK